MKKRVSAWMACFLAVIVALAGTACKKGPDKAGTAKEPAGHDKTVEGHLKSVEDSKKVVVARVNGVNIMMNDLMNRMAQITFQHSGRGQHMTPEVRQKGAPGTFSFAGFMVSRQDTGNLGKPTFSETSFS